MRTAYLSAGSNLGDRKKNLEFAVTSLSRGNTILKISPCYETEPVGYLNQPWFLNLALEIGTLLSPLELLGACKEIEASCGRIRTFPNAPRTLDLDILLFEDLVVNEPELVIPHPRMPVRRFVLEPLVQIAPDVVHPVLNKSIRALLEQCPDASGVRAMPCP